VLASLGSPVFAATVVFDLANLKYDGSGTTLSDFTGFKPSDGKFCTAGDLCSSNVNNNILGDDLTYGLGGSTIHATGYYNGNRVAVVQDHDNGYNGLLFGSAAIGAGLGVYRSGTPARLASARKRSGVSFCGYDSYPFGPLCASIDAMG